MQAGKGVNRRELRNYLHRVEDRWPIEAAVLGGARVAAEAGSSPQRKPSADIETAPAFVVVLVSAAYDGMPWLERIHQAGSLWDALEMGARAELHCYTPREFARKRASLPAVREAAERGLDLMALS